MEPITKDSASSVSFSPGNATLGVWRRRRGKGARAACGRAEQLFCPLSVVGPAAGTGPSFLPRSLSPPLTPRGPPRTRIHIQVCDNVDVRPLKSALKSGRGSTPTASLPATPTRRRAGTPPAPPGAFSGAVAADATQPRYYVRRSGAGARKRDPALAALGRVLAAAGVVEAGRGGAGATTSAAALGASAVPDAAPAHVFILACSACGKGEVDSLVSKAGVRATVFRCVWWTGGAGGGASLFHACGDPSLPRALPPHLFTPPPSPPKCTHSTPGAASTPAALAAAAAAATHPSTPARLFITTAHVGCGPAAAALGEWSAAGGRHLAPPPPRRRAGGGGGAAPSSHPAITPSAVIDGLRRAVGAVWGFLTDADGGSGGSSGSRPGSGGAPLCGEWSVSAALVAGGGSTTPRSGSGNTPPAVAAAPAPLRPDAPVSLDTAVDAVAVSRAEAAWRAHHAEAEGAAEGGTQARSCRLGSPLPGGSGGGGGGGAALLAAKAPALHDFAPPDLTLEARVAAMAGASAGEVSDEAAALGAPALLRVAARAVATAGGDPAGLGCAALRLCGAGAGGPAAPAGVLRAGWCDVPASGGGRRCYYYD